MISAPKDMSDWKTLDHETLPINTTPGLCPTNYFVKISFLPEIFTQNIQGFEIILNVRNICIAVFLKKLAYFSSYENLKLFFEMDQLFTKNGFSNGYNNIAKMW